MVICCVSALCVRAVPLSVTGYVSAFLRVRVHARAHYFARYLTVTVKIHTLGIIIAVALARSLVWWGSL